MIKIFVFDTNSLISANLTPHSVNRKAFDKARELGIPVYSKFTLAELIAPAIELARDGYEVGDEFENTGRSAIAPPARRGSPRLIGCRPGSSFTLSVRAIATGSTARRKSLQAVTEAAWSWQLRTA